MIYVHAELTARAVTQAQYYRLVCSTEQFSFEKATKLSHVVVSGSLFQVLGPHTAKLCGLYVDVFVLSSTRVPREAERRFLRPGSTETTSHISSRYCGASW